VSVTDYRGGSTKVCTLDQVEEMQEGPILPFFVFSFSIILLTGWACAAGGPDEHPNNRIFIKNIIFYKSYQNQIKLISNLDYE